MDETPAASELRALRDTLHEYGWPDAMRKLIYLMLRDAPTSLDDRHQRRLNQEAHQRRLNQEAHRLLDLLEEEVRAERIARSPGGAPAPPAPETPGQPPTT